MVSFNRIKEMIRVKLPDAEVFVKDLTGGGDHLEAVVVSTEFEGKTRVKQHQIVYAALEEDLASGAIHALALKTYTPQTWKAEGQPV
jgi:acid stress-induced BolA-like protein IbaG/YrbA